MTIIQEGMVENSLSLVVMRTYIGNTTNTNDYMSQLGHSPLFLSAACQTTDEIN